MFVSTTMKSKHLRFEYGKKSDGLFYWHVKAANGEIVAQGEGYKRKAGVVKVFHLLFDLDNCPVLVDLDEPKCCGGKCSAKKPKNYEGKLCRNWP